MDFPHFEATRQGRDFLSLIHCNLRSITKNLDLILSYISQHTYDIVISETWLRKGEKTKIPGYTMLSQPRESIARGGGVALFIRDNISFQYLPDCSYSCQSAETLFVKLENGAVIGVVYRPPNSCVNNFISQMESVIDPIVSVHSPLLFVVT